MRGYFALFLFLAACGDRNLDDYQKDRVAEEVAKIDSISGIYDGEVIRKSDGVSLGHLVMELQPDTQINLPNDKVVAQRQVFLKGSLELRDQKSKFISFSGAYYDSTTNTFQAMISMIDSNSNLKLDMIGKVNRSDILGTIEVKGFPESQTTFKLRRSSDQTQRPIQILKNESAMPEGSPLERWDAVKVTPSSSSDAKSFFTIREIDTTSEQEFFQVFAPLKYVDAALYFSEKTGISFSNALWDLRTGRLSAKAHLNLGSSAPERDIILNCISISDVQKNLGWNCTYINNGAAVIFDFEFRKKAS